MVRKNTTKRQALRREQELFASARSYLSHAFPNPERSGCPLDEALRLLAADPQKGGDEYISGHLTCCSPCFNAYLGYLTQARDRVRRIRWIRRSTAGIATVVILVTVLYLFMAKHRHPQVAGQGNSAPTATSESPGQTQTATKYVPVLIDLSNASPTRGPKGGADRPMPQTIPAASPVSLSLRLPLGSEERRYLMTLTAGRQVMWSASAQAKRQNGDTLLHVNADFKDLPPGSYNLQVSSGSRRLSVPVMISANSEHQH